MRLRISRTRLVNLRARFVLWPDWLPEPWPWRTTLLLLPAVLKISACSRRSAEHRYRSSDIDRVIECNCKLIGHSHTTVRRRITGQIAGVHSIRTMEPHEIRHRRGNKSATARHVHIDVSIGHDRPAVTVDDFAIDTRMMTPLLLDNFERASLGQMSVTPARYRRLHHNASAADQIGSLPAQIDLNSIWIFVLRRRGCRD